MSIQTAKDHYVGKLKPRLNCAQSVAAAFSQGKDLLDELAFCGVGNAPDGWCGAAYAAARITGDQARVEKAFRESAGDISCWAIRGGRKLSCVGCVEKGAQLILEKGII